MNMSAHLLKITYCLYALAAAFTFFPRLAKTEVPSEDTMPHYYFALAENYRAEGATQQALFYYKKVLEEAPTHFESLYNAANILFHQHQYTDSAELYNQILEIQPDHAETYSNLGVCYIKLKDKKKAINCFSTALSLDPKDARAHVQVGIMYEEAKQYESALQHYKAAERELEKDADIHHHLGRTYKNLDQLEQATKEYEQALKIKPKNLTFLSEYANILNMLERNEEALIQYKQILNINPNLTTIKYNYGYTLKKLGRVEEAIDIYHEVLKVRPDYPHANFSLSLSYLTLGNFEEGWPRYEWRWAAYKENPKRFDSPLWDGSDLNGKIILLYAEQGFGDTFQFIRYAKELKKQGAIIFFETQRALKTLLEQCPYIDMVFKRGETPPPHDYHMALMSLPMMFKTTIDSVPHEIPYLYADKELVEYWKNELATDTHIKVGLCWQGNSFYQTQALKHAVALKSMKLIDFEPLSNVPNISFYSIQRMNGMEQLHNLPKTFTVHDFGADFDQSHGRFMDTMAVIKNLDLVITIDTSIGHLAAALGKETWVVLPTPPDWRWMLDRSDTPWYPNMRLFRQHTPGDWHAVMQEVAHALEKKTGSSSLKPIIYKSRTSQMTHHDIQLEEYIDQEIIKTISQGKNKSDQLDEIINSNKERIPEIVSLVTLLTNMNKQIASLYEEIENRSLSAFDEQMGDISKQIAVAHSLKKQIKDKIHFLNQK